MNGISDKFFSGAALAGHQHRRIDIGYAAHQFVNPAHLRTGSRQTIAATHRIEPLLNSLERTLQLGVLVGTKTKDLQIPNRRWSPAVAEGPQPDQVLRCRPKDVFRHHHARNAGIYHAPERRDLLLQSIRLGMQIENDDVTRAQNHHTVDFVLSHPQDNLKVRTEGRRKKRLQGAIFGVKRETDHEHSS